MFRNFRMENERNNYSDLRSQRLIVVTSAKEISTVQLSRFMTYSLIEGRAD